MERLINIGFVEVGSWSIMNGSLNHNILPQNKGLTDLLYAFVHRAQVKYIGKTADKLNNRMSGYKNAGGSQRTNIRIKGEIVNLLNAGQSVRIFVLVDTNEFVYRGFRMSLASGLEDTLIASIQPQWNYRGNNRVMEQEMPSTERRVIVESVLAGVEVVQTVVIQLGQEYFTNGRFNFPVAYLQNLPEHDAYVTLFLGENSDFFIQGRFHLTGANRRQPRVEGNVALTEWFQTNNFNVGDLFNVDILDSHTFRIRR